MKKLLLVIAIFNLTAVLASEQIGTTKDGEPITYQNIRSFKGKFKKASFEGAEVKRQLKLKRVCFQEAKFNNAKIFKLEVETGDFRSAELKKATFKRRVRFIETDFRKALCIYAFFEGVTFVEVNFEGAKLQNVKFKKVTFEHVNFGGANLRNIKLEETSFKGADLKGAIMDEKSIKKHGLQDKGLLTPEESKKYETRERKRLFFCGCLREEARKASLSTLIPSGVVGIITFYVFCSTTGFNLSI